ncbi:MAG TPA: MBL fold metallo-hydrolase [Anaerolineae bacterium]
MKVTLWGTRGSIPSPGPDTVRYGGNTSCVEVVGDDGTVLVLDAGTGILRLGRKYTPPPKRIDLLLTHLHMDHLQGLGFFAPLFDPNIDVHIWGPASATESLQSRLTRYLSPPLFPVRLRDVPCHLFLHHVPGERVQVGEFQIISMLLCHPGPTVGYRIENARASLAYLPDHEPALTPATFARQGEWTSGYALAFGVDLLLHDSQYTNSEYAQRAGWGHSSMEDSMRFAQFARVKCLMPFHHDPEHSDDQVDELIHEAQERVKPDMTIIPATEGLALEI